MATIHDVARTANVSVATVSRVLNNSRPVHPAVRRAVESAVKQLNYHPNAAARGLRRARSRTIGVLTPELGDELYARRILGIERLLGEQGFGLFVCDTQSDSALALKRLVLLQEHRVEGLILAPPPSARVMRVLAGLEAQGMRIVLIARRRSVGDHPEVYVDEHHASITTFRRLLALGHRRIAMLATTAGPLQAGKRTTTAESRVLAYLQAHQEAGVPVDTSLLTSARNGDEARGQTAALLAGPNRPTALVVGLHSHTPDVLLAVRRAGLAIPGDVSLVVYGDSRWVEAHDPPITVIRVDDVAYGRRAAELLLDLLNGQPAQRSIPFPAEIVERASCAPPPA